jgi:hypothetical protein
LLKNGLFHTFLLFKLLALTVFAIARIRCKTPATAEVAVLAMAPWAMTIYKLKQL